MMAAGILCEISFVAFPSVFIKHESLETNNPNHYVPRNK